MSPACTTGRLAPYDNKLDVDANYKRMVDYGMIPENIQAVHLGIASHNLFELAYAASLAKQNGVSANMSFEMLEGMADHVRRAIQESTGGDAAVCAGGHPGSVYQRHRLPDSKAG